MTGVLQWDERTLQRVVEAAPLILWSIDDKGVLKLSVGRSLAALGLAPNQNVGRSVFEMYAQYPEMVRSIRRGLAGEELTNTHEVGDLVFETLFAPLRDGAGAVVGLMGVSIDVTERRRAEKEQARLQAQLLQVQKLESLGLLAGGIAHDFNNILTTILGGASNALLTLPPETPARACVDAVVSAARRAAALTRQMLAYSGKAHVEIRPIDLAAHVREIAALLETTVSKKVQLRLELQERLPAIEADVAQVQQIVMNLVINGAEAIGDREGTVLVTAGRQTIDRGFAASLIAADEIVPGEYVFLQVQDTGAGMDEATRDKIFDPFFTTKFTGRGLGLAAVLGIVRGHRGAIQVASTPGRGTSFKVFFPASRAAVGRDAPAAPALDFRGQGLVLIIDDDAGVRASLQRMLGYFGFSVIQAENGQEGSELFAKRASEIKLVLVDMTMPKMSGEETFRAIRNTRADVPVILTSGYSEIDATRRFTSEGLAGFLEKPFTPADLAARLRKVLGSEPT
jgi:two-component system cell cycle sensor histidine kinase/response regulator CckA